jgi:DHA2 family multidrug resistance protein-like MFS transporter
LLFTLASLGCAYAWSLPSLLTARALQGLGASGIMSVNSALISFVYPNRLLGRGFGHNALVVATAFTLGPTLASAILAFGSWPWLFAVNIPFGLIAMGIGIKTLPDTPRAVRAFDFPAAGLAAMCLGLFILGIGSAAHKASPVLVSIELASAALLVGFLIRRHAGHPAPMLPVDLFRRPMFALSAATAVCSFAVQGLAFVSLPFYFEDILHRTQIETGFFMTPWPLVVGIMAPIGGRLSDRYSAGVLGGLGLVLLGVGMVLLATLPKCCKACAKRQRNRGSVAGGKGKTQCRQRRANCLSGQARGGDDAAGAAAAIGRRARHDGPDIGRLEEAESHPANHHPPDDVERAGRWGSVASKTIPTPSSTSPRPPSTPAE